MNVIVTGGAGFIGSALVRYLIAETGVSVTVIDKLTYAANLDSLAPVAASPRYRLVREDICNAPAMRDIFAAQKPDLVLHLAAESHVDRSISGPQAFIETNINGTYSLLEAARAYHAGLPAGRRDAFRFLHVSTDEVFGSLGPEGRFSESSPYDPSSPYSASKAASDHLVRAWHRTFGLPVIISNCSNNYGPYHFPEKLIPLTIINALEGKPVRVYGDGSNIRDWLYVDDHARALWRIATAGVPGATYTVGGNSERTNLEVVQAICDVLDALRPDGDPHRRLIEFTEDRPGHDQRYAIDTARIESELGWKAQETFETGLQKTVQWYLDRPDWWRPLREKVYSGERLGLAASGE